MHLLVQGLLKSALVFEIVGVGNIPLLSNTSEPLLFNKNGQAPEAGQCSKEIWVVFGECTPSVQNPQRHCTQYCDSVV